MTHSKMKIVFMGTSDFAVPALNLLMKNHEDVVGVITRPDRPKGRGRKVTAPPVKKFAQCMGLNIFQPENVKDELFIAQLKALHPDVIVVAAFGQFLPNKILTIPPLGCVNIHPSLLPRYRGPAPINWVIINGEKKTGVTTMLLNDGMDSGDIFLQREVEIQEDDTAEILNDRLAKIGAKLLMETLCRLKKNSIAPIPQDHSKATVVPILKKDDGLIDWTKDSLQISDLIRGLIPWPCAYTHLQGRTLKIFKAKALERNSTEITPGTVTEICKEGITVSTGKGFLLIKEIQLQDHKRMNAADFIRGCRGKIDVGMVLMKG